MSHEYKIKGRGDTRTVVDPTDDRVVGSIHKVKVKSTSGTITKTGSSFRTRTVTNWEATWDDGDIPVMERGGQGRPIRCLHTTMKAWSNAWAWKPRRVISPSEVTT